MAACAVFSAVVLLASSPQAQHQGHGAHSSDFRLWEGSPAGKDYSEFNHHLAGVFMLLMGLSELGGALGTGFLVWSRFVLPLAMLGAGMYLLGWSDHEAWPIGSLSLQPNIPGRRFRDPST